MFTYQAEFTDAYNWNKCGTGLRTNFGSYIKSKLATYSEVQHAVKLSSISSFNINLVLQQDGRADRAFLEFIYTISFSENHSLYLTQTLSDEKKDLDFTAGYNFTNDKLGALDLGITAQNFINNLVNDVGNSTVKRIRDIFEVNNRNIPLFLYSRYTSNPDNFWYLDVSSGYQPTKKVDRLSNNDPDYLVSDDEDIFFINSSLSFSLLNFTFGPYFYYDRSYLDRSSDTGNPFNGFYTTEQKLQRIGLFGYAYFKRFTPQIKLSFEDFSDIQSGSDFTTSTVDQAFSYKEDRALLNIGNAFHLFDSKLSILVRYLSFLRTNDPSTTRILTKALQTESFIYPAQRRATITFQATLHKDVYFELGVGFDIDKDNKGNPNIPDRIFDKGYGKLLLSF